MKSKSIINYLLLLLLIINYTASAQTWSAPVQVVNPNIGTGATSGQFSKLLVVNGNPAMANYARYRLQYVRASDASGTAAWTAVTVDAAFGRGKYLSLQIVNGIPAISYYDEINGDLKYVFANDASGNSWSTPVTVDAAGDVGQYTSLQMVNGRPAISYYDVTNGDLKYVRADNASGTDWSVPLTLDATGNVGLFTSLKIVNGVPAIAYYDATRVFNGPVTEDLKYISAFDVSGTTGWDTPVTVDDAGTVGQYLSLQIVNGIPAISYFDLSFQDLKYVSAIDASGTNWATPITIDAFGYVGLYTSLQIVNGNPAISYYDQGNSKLKYVRANDASGTAPWGTPITPVALPYSGTYSSLHIVNGNPAISYCDQSKFDLAYVRATDASGTAPWGTPVTHDAVGRAGESISLQTVNGNPAISYYNGTYDYTPGSLKYVRATNPFGTAWGIPSTPDSVGGSYTSLQVVKGNPAISYSTNSGLKYVRSSDASGINWNLPISLAAGDVALDVSLYTVNGNPAISYYAYDFPNGSLKYIRATDSAGTIWNTPAITIDAAADVGQYASLQMINGIPAISYYDGTNGNLKFVRATDTAGTIWNTPSIAIDTAGTVGKYSSLQIVNGYPAISYFNESSGDLKYVRAADSSGTSSSWGTPTTADAVGIVGKYTSLQIVNGYPAISYFNESSGDLKYVRADDSSGISWGTPSTLAIGGRYTSMIATANEVAIAYQNTVEELPYFISGTISSLHFRTRQSGNWNDINTWESSPVSDFSSAVISPATISPDFNSNTITIRNGHTVTITANVTVDQTSVNNGGAIIVNNGSSFFINHRNF